MLQFEEKIDELTNKYSLSKPEGSFHFTFS